MSDSQAGHDSAEGTAHVGSVAQAILGQFFDALAAKEGLGDVAAKLRKVVLEDEVFAELAVRIALFPDAL